ncbi:hypothetical protein GW17_00032462 [Ensete ventricosum]|nr:hypothetical protein GW17_00032462 [Ensete ventricosum]RZR96641.1 hypothetical protein BHM03_00025695 [Ensete ventricosum]
MKDSRRGSVRSTTVSSSDERQLRPFAVSRIGLSMCSADTAVSSFAWWLPQESLSTGIGNEHGLWHLPDTARFGSFLSTATSGV